MAEKREDWVFTKADARAWDEGCRPSRDAAQRVRDFFFRFLRHSKGEWAGKPFVLQDWQWEDVIRPLFGWLRPDGTRRFRRAYIEVSKKNGKSTLAAGIGLYMLIADGEQGAEVFSAAADREQASIVFNEAASMVKASPELSDHVQVVPSTKRLVFPKTGSFYHALSADAYRQEGLNIHCLSFDELHAQKTRDLWDTLTYGGASRRQPLLFAITTAGFDRNSICWEEHQKAKNILDGTFDDPSSFAYISAADEDGDWTDPAQWAKANPSMGVTIRQEEMAEACAEAQASPTKENAFRRYRLNQWTEQDVRWLTMDVWDACITDIDTDGLKSRPCYAGLDLSSKKDLTALSLIFPDGEGGYDWLAHFWSPADTARERERVDKVPYVTWGKQGFIDLTDGNVVDYAKVISKTVEYATRYKIKELAIDRFQAEHMMQLFSAEGIEVVPFAQNMASMSDPMKEMERLLLSKRLRHQGHPVLRWMAGNVAVMQDGNGNIKTDKKSSSEKIDGIVSGIMALGRAMVTPMNKGSVYERRGLLRIGV